MGRSLDKQAVSQAELNRDDSAYRHNDATIAVMGLTGSGKSTFISKLVGDEVVIGHQLESCESRHHDLYK